MNIAILLGSTRATGGIGRVSAMLANGLSESGNNVSLIEYYKDSAPEIYEINDSVVIHQLYPRPVSMTKALLSNGVKALRSILLKEKTDVLIAAGALFYPLSILAAKDIKTKTVCWEHSDPNGAHDHKLQRACRVFGAKQSDACVVLTDAAVSIYRNKLKAKQIVRIYNPIDPQIIEQRVNYCSSSSRIISVGRLSYQKNIQCAIRVARIVLPKADGWTWDIYGEGDEAQELQSMIHRFGLEGKVNLRGRVGDLYNRYREYAFLVMTSRYEGFPMTLLEAMGNSLPMVAFDVPTGPREIIIDGENGLLVEQDDEMGMAMAISQLISSPETRVRMAAANLKRSESFSIDVFYNSWIKLLEELCVH